MNKKNRQNQRLDGLEERALCLENELKEQDGALRFLFSAMERINIHIAEGMAKDQGFSNLEEFLKAQEEVSGGVLEPQQSQSGAAAADVSK